MTPDEGSANGKTQLTATDYETLASFRYGVRRYLAFAEANARSVGLTSQQHQALLLRGMPGRQDKTVLGDDRNHLADFRHELAIS